jgi:hypothetical protein
MPNRVRHARIPMQGMHTHSWFSYAAVLPRDCHAAVSYVGKGLDR